MNLPVAIILAIVSFVAISFLVFFKLVFPQYLYTLLAIGLVSSLSFEERNRSLKIWFTSAIFQQIRLIENIILAVPFVLFLIWKGFFILALTLLIFSLLLAIINNLKPISKVIPSPFSKLPFEYTIGFRKFIIIIVINFILLGVSVQVGNFNLGLFTLLVNALLGMYFYANNEPFNYVWENARTPKDFILYKLRICIKHNFTLSSIFTLVLIFFYPQHFYIVLGIYLYGQSIVILKILGKYSYYPKEMKLHHAIMLSLSIIIFPLMLITLPYFYKKSIQNLKAIL